MIWRNPLNYLFSQPQVIDTLALKKFRCIHRVLYVRQLFWWFLLPDCDSLSCCHDCYIYNFIYFYVSFFPGYTLLPGNKGSRLFAESIGQNDISSFIECNESNILEFEEINRALAHLISQKIELEKLNQLEKYEKKIMPSLQYFQLQTRSHFFLLIV